MVTVRTARRLAGLGGTRNACRGFPRAPRDIRQGPLAAIAPVAGARTRREMGISMQAARFFRRGLLAVWLLAAAGAAGAQDVVLRASVDRSTIRENESFTYVLAVQGQVRDEPDVSMFAADFEILQRSRNTSIQMQGGRTSQITEWRYQMMPRRAGSFTLAPLEVAGALSNPVELEILPALAGDAPGDIFLEVEISPATAYVQSQVIYTQRLYRAVSTGRSSLTPPDVTGGETIVVPLGEDREYQTVRDERTFIVLERRYAVFPQVAGELTIQPMVFEAVVITASGFSSLQRFRSEPVSLSVLPAVAPPPEFAGAAWLPARDVAIEQRWSGDPEEFTAGIPQTRTLRVEAQGVLETQIPDLSLFETDSLQQYADQPEMTRQSSAEGTHAVRTERFAVIAQAAGALTIPAVELPWFNVNSREWEVARVDPREVTVLPSREPGAAPAPSPAPAALPVEPVHTGARLWQGISAALLAAWAVTLLAWWQSGRVKRAAALRQPAAETPARVSDRRLLRQLRAACNVNDAANARRLLLEWGAARFGEQVKSLGRLAALLPADLTAAIGELERSLYGPDSPAWNGQALSDALAQADAVNRSGVATAGERELLPLYR